MKDGDGTAAAKAYLWTFGSAEFDEARWELRVNGQAVELERKPLEVLQYLLRHAGEAVTKEELLSGVWTGRVVVEAVLPNTIGKLRKALNDNDQDVIATLARIGYRLAVPVARKPVDYLPETSQLSAGDLVPRRQNWCLDRPLARTEGNEVWLASHTKTHESRVFKFSLIGKDLAGLKREVTISRLLREALGERQDFVRVIDWDFEDAPYFVEAEYGGVSLDRWDIKTLSLPQRLEMFAEAADAVASAHAVGVLHKDIKPANLLIYEKDGVPHLRVADFGSSRLFDSGTLDGLGITRLGLTQVEFLSADNSGTPLYLAPEVVAGQSPTIKSDIYALGVTLYQMVVGDFRRPLSPGWENDIEDELLRRDIAEAANGDPSKRPLSAAELSKRICMLEVRREQLALETSVRARVAEGEKKLEKVRARRPWVIAASVLLAAGLGATGWQLNRTITAERIASEQRDKAEVQAKRAEAVVQFLSKDLLSALAPGGEAFEKDPTIKDMLEYASTNVEGKFKDDPATLGSLHAAIGASWSAFDQRDRSSDHFLKAWENNKQAFGESDEQTLLTLYSYAEEVVMAQKFDEAKKLLDEADRLAGPRLMEEGQLAFFSAQRRANYHVQQQEIAEAEPFLKRAIGLLPKVFPDSPRQDAILRMRLADVYRRQDKQDAAEAIIRQTLSDPRFTQETLGDGLINSLRSLLAQILSGQGKYSEAIVLAQKVALTEEERLGKDARTTIINWERVAKIHAAADDCVLALEIRRRIWEIGVAKHGLADRSNLSNGANLAASEEKCGDKSRVLPLVQLVLHEVRKNFGLDDPFNHSFTYLYARTLIDAGRYEEARSELESVNVEKYIAAIGNNGQEQWMNAQRARILIGTGKKEEGRSLLASSLDALEKRDVPGSAQQLAAYRKLLSD